MSSNKDLANLVWLDMEMTGLDPHINVILEVAVIITDSELNILTESPSYVIKQPAEELLKMDKWNVNTHTKSGLITRVNEQGMALNLVEAELLKLLKKFVTKGKSPLCGNTIYQDRKFIIKYMPQLDAYLHYRHIDVSTIKELAKRWYPNLAAGFKKHNKHQALDDIRESIEELKYYRQKLFMAKSTEVASLDLN